ncbi:hypothetical protein EOPP23_04795 [Endozoicomonas sp. OPT23]|nr:hypothetical protein [Endozoicomonas sp. OPT23]
MILVLQTIQKPYMRFYLISLQHPLRTPENYFFNACLNDFLLTRINEAFTHHHKKPKDNNLVSEK